MGDTNIIWGRHIGYRKDGTPLFRRMEQDECGPAQFPIVRHLGYLNDGTPIVATSSGCCDAVAPDCGTCQWHWQASSSSWILDHNDCTCADCLAPTVQATGQPLFDGEIYIKKCGFVREDCLAPGYCCYQWNAMGAVWVLFSQVCSGSCFCHDPPTRTGLFDGEQQCFNCVGDCPNGIAENLLMRAFDVQNCFSANGRVGGLNFNGVGQWEGDMTLVNGAIHVKLDCQFQGSGTVWTLTYTGCGGGGTMFGPSCINPLRIPFQSPPLGPLNTCCDCFLTDKNSQIGIMVEGNCPATVLTRHVDYAASGTPVFATVGNCTGLEPHTGCGDIQCAIILSFIADPDGPCACMNKSYYMSYNGGGWLNQLDDAGCNCQIGISVVCNEILDEDGKPTGSSRFHVSALCEPGGKTASLDAFSPAVPDTELLDLLLDVSFPGGFHQTDTCKDSVCTWSWTFMPPMWVGPGTSCPVNCACTYPTFDGTFMGQGTTTQCVSTLDCCCDGAVTIRIQRALSPPATPFAAQIALPKPVLSGQMALQNTTKKGCGCAKPRRQPFPQGT